MQPTTKGPHADDWLYSDPLARISDPPLYVKMGAIPL